MAHLAAVVLAAGKGTRMKSQLPKVLHPVGGKPMVQHVLKAARTCGATRLLVVVGYGAQQVQEALAGEAEFVLQEEQLGTGHAMMQVQKQLADFTGTVMVLCGDTPLLTGELLADLFNAHCQARAAATILTARLDDPAGYGRVIRAADGAVERIVEEKDATPDQLVVREVNTGIYCFEREPLFRALSRLDRNNRQGEYYLTDVIHILRGEGAKVWAQTAPHPEETLGVNSRAQLAAAEKVLRQRKLAQVMDSGVTVMDPASTFIDADVTIGADTVIYPFTWLEGRTKIGRACRIGPSTRLTDVTMGNEVVIHFSYAHGCEIQDGATIGPYVHLRPQTRLAEHVKVGNFVEVKNSTVGRGSKIPHLSYIGDTDMGAGVNIGSGTITVNYDGRHKHRTVIEDGAFIGCNTNLVAPVKVGQGAYIAAGSTITQDVPAQALGVARARQTNIAGWAKDR